MQVNVVTHSHGHIEFDGAESYSFDQGYLYVMFDDGGTAHVPENNIAWVRVEPDAETDRDEPGE